MKDVTTLVFENKTIVLTWQQPDNAFEEANFTYNITATSLSTGHVLETYLLTQDALQSPWEQFDFSEVEFCEEVNFTVRQAGDCREQYATTALPICKMPIV